uniref:SGNH domain-containing protein n=1 Tax=Panagrolaimus sp. JU765 TaxID=591449 RepID=A0AC34R046_9BILA
MIPRHPAIALNQQIAEDCKHVDKVVNCQWDPEMLQIAKKPTRPAAYFCSYEGSGEVTALVTGNSYALRQIIGIKQALKSHYKKIYFAARPACLAFESFDEKTSGYWHCQEIKNKTLEFVSKLKPDFLVITQMLWPNRKFGSPVTVEEAKNDSTTKIVADYFKAWSPHVKNIFVIEPHPKIGFHPAPRLAQLLSQNKSTEGVFLRYKDWKKQVDPGWNRILAAMETCPKCVPVPIRDFFCKDESCELFEQKTMLSLYCDAGHFSPHGVERIVPTLREKFNKAMKNLKR